MIDAHDPRLLGVSASIVTNASRVRDLIDDIRAHRGPASPWIVVGGGAFRSAPGLWKEIGADGFADGVRSAVDAAREIVPAGG